MLFTDKKKSKRDYVAGAHFEDQWRRGHYIGHFMHPEEDDYKFMWIIQDLNQCLIKENLLVSLDTAKYYYGDEIGVFVWNKYIVKMIEVGLLIPVGNTNTYIPSDTAYRNYINYGNWYECDRYKRFHARQDDLVREYKKWEDIKA